jgi:hypothetical protein
MRKLLTSIAVFILCTSAALANNVTQKYIKNAAMVGTGTLSIVLWDVYDATLYAPNGKWDATAPFALSISYLREIEGIDIADRSIEEIRKQGFSNESTLSTWQSELRGIFPNVKNGSELTAIYIPGKKTQFYSANKFIGSVNGDEFGKQFFNIWLSEKTSEPSLRRKLLGLS